MREMDMTFATGALPFLRVGVAGDSPSAREAPQRIQAVFAIEAEIRGRSAKESPSAAPGAGRTLLEDLYRWFQETAAKLSCGGGRIPAPIQALSN